MGWDCGQIVCPRDYRWVGVQYRWNDLILGGGGWNIRIKRAQVLLRLSQILQGPNLARTQVSAVRYRLLANKRALDLKHFGSVVTQFIENGLEPGANNHKIPTASHSITKYRLVAVKMRWSWKMFQNLMMCAPPLTYYTRTFSCSLWINMSEEPYQLAQKRAGINGCMLGVAFSCS